MRLAQTALGVARSLEAIPFRLRTEVSRPLARFLVMGDPQVEDDRFFRLLEQRGLLGADGMLRPDVGLLSVGDHFDPHAWTEHSAGQGLRLLRWLAEHPRAQVPLLLGNHDAVRVQEFICFTDETFSKARALGRRIKQPGPGDDVVALTAAFHAAYPWVPTPGLAAQDFASFCAAQRRLVMELLGCGRLALAAVVRLHHREVLVTHAGLSGRELRLLGLEGERRSGTLAAALNAFLGQAVERVAPRWAAGALVPLDLSPLHVTGIRGEECGGLLAHRPSNPARTSGRAPNPQWELNPERPRRFNPATLPVGLSQMAGHTGHKSCAQELPPWVEPASASRAMGGVRTLEVRAGVPSYRHEIHPAEGADSVLYLVDGEMTKVPDEQVEFVAVDGW